MDLMGKVEEQLLCSWQGQLINSGVLEEVETMLDTLKIKVDSVVHTKHIRKMEREIDVVKKKVDSPTQSGVIPPRPRKSAYFVGRIKKLRQAKHIVQEHGSASITGYGGLGKSQLMTAFAQLAEANGDVPGGVFWAIADGDKSQVVEALAGFVETLKGATIPETERPEPEVALSVLKNLLNEASGRWLLCVGNVHSAGDTEVRGIIDEVAALADPSKKNGWVVLTSRYGQATVWNSMEEDQNVVLPPLSVEGGVCVLWRYMNSIRSDKTTDENIAEALAQFSYNKKSEYSALRELFGYGWNRSLAGLPLALIHSGAYIRKFKCSFSEYLELYRESSGKFELKEILEKAEDIALKPEQRAILTTWTISMSRLSEEARKIVRAVAMLGNARIPGDVMKETLKELGETEKSGSPIWVRRRFHKLVMGELVFDSSLLRRYENETETTLEIHRLVRMFVLVDLGQEKDVLEKAFRNAALATHTCVDLALKKQGKDFDSMPNSRPDRQFWYFPYSLSLVIHFTSSSIA